MTNTDHEQAVEAARIAYETMAAALPEMTGTLYRDAEHPAEVIRQMLPDALHVYGWWGNTANSQTGRQYKSAPCYLLWQTPEMWFATTVKDRDSDAFGWRNAPWYLRVALIERALGELRADQSLLGLALLLSNRDNLTPWDQSSDTPPGLVWGAYRLMDDAERSRFETMLSLAGYLRPGKRACDVHRGIVEQTATGAVQVIYTDLADAR
jgi:hypothetical protein